MRINGRRLGQTTRQCFRLGQEVERMDAMMAEGFSEVSGLSDPNRSMSFSDGSRRQAISDAQLVVSLIAREMRPRAPQERKALDDIAIEAKKGSDAVLAGKPTGAVLKIMRRAGDQISFLAKRLEGFCQK